MTKFPFDTYKSGAVSGPQGEINVLLQHADKNAPVVFMFDESHGNADKYPDTPVWIKENIKAAAAFIEDFRPIGLIGVESHAAYELLSSKSLSLNKRPDFANYFQAAGQLVYGVEDEKLCDQLIEAISDELLTNPDLDQNKFIRAHRLNTDRSHAYLETLFDIRKIHKLAGDMMLNAGREHINHIKDLIEAAKIEEVAGGPASYVRFTPASFPGT